MTCVSHSLSFRKSLGKGVGLGRRPPSCCAGVRRTGFTLSFRRGSGIPTCPPPLTRPCASVLLLRGYTPCPSCGRRDVQVLWSDTARRVRRSERLFSGPLLNRPFRVSTRLRDLPLDLSGGFFDRKTPFTPGHPLNQTRRGWTSSTVRGGNCCRVFDPSVNPTFVRCRLLRGRGVLKDSQVGEDYPFRGFWEY